MRKIALALIAAGFLLNACKHHLAAHLPQEQMAPILADLHLADAYSSILHDTTRPEGGKNYDSLASWTKAILAKHRTSPAEFNDSMEWYRDNPTELDSLYAKVIPILERNKK